MLKLWLLWWYEVKYWLHNSKPVCTWHDSCAVVACVKVYATCLPGMELQHSENPLNLNCDGKSVVKCLPNRVGQQYSCQCFGFLHHPIICRLHIDYVDFTWFPFKCSWDKIKLNIRFSTYWGVNNMADILQTTFKMHFMEMEIGALIKISLNFVLKGSVNIKSIVEHQHLLPFKSQAIWK